MDHPCYPCQKLSDISECGGCILKEYFNTDAEIDDLKVLCENFEKESVKKIISDIKNGGGSVSAFIKQMMSLVPHLIRLTETTYGLKLEVDDLKVQIVNLTNLVNNLKSNQSSPSVGMRDVTPQVGSPMVGSHHGDDDDSGTTIVPDSLGGNGN